MPEDDSSLPASNIQNLFSEGPVVLFVWKAEPGWPVEFVSQNIAGLLGYSPQEVLAPSFYFMDLLHPDDLQRTADEIQAHFLNRSEQFEQFYRLHRMDGSFRWVHDYTRPEYDHSGQVVRIQGYLLDQTPLKQTEAELIQERSRLQGILEGTNVGTWEWNVQTGETIFNPRWAEMAGYTLDELRPTTIQTWMDLAHPDDLPGSSDLLQRHFSGDLAYYEYEARMRHKHGHWIWVLDRGRVMTRTEDGKPLLMAGTHQDITQRKRDELALRKSQARLEESQRLARVGHWEANLRTGTLWWSDVIYEIFGRNPAAFTPSVEAFNQAVHPEDVALVRQSEARAMETGRHDVEHRIILPTGEVRWVHELATSEKDEQGDPVRLIGTVQDITDRKEAEAALRISEKRFRDVAAAAGEYIWETDAQGRYTFLSEPFKALIGLPLDQALGRTPFAFMPLVEAERVQKLFLGYVAKQKPFRGLEHCSLRADGEIVWQRVSGVPMFDDHGVLSGYRGTALDITETRRAVEAVENLSLRLQLAVESARVGIWDYDVPNDRLIWDKTMFELYGVHAEEFDGAYSAWQNGLHPEDVQRAMKEFEDSLLGKRAFDTEFRIRRPDGEVRWLKAYGQVRRDEAGQALRIVGTNWDTTERKQAELALAENNRHTQAILDNVIDGIVTIDQERIVTSFNRAAERIFGYSAEEVLGRNVNMLMPEPYHTEHDGYVSNYLKTGTTKVIGIGREVEARRKNAEIFPMDLSVSEITRNGRKLFIGVIRDITERKRMERMKNEFVATVSHELRTPLTSINGPIGLLLGGALGEIPEAARRMLEVAHKNSQRLGALINDLLDIEKIAAGKMRFALQTQEIMPLVEQALLLSQPHAAQNQIELRLVERAMEVWVRVDGQRLQQILTNFLSNATKFSPKDGVVRVGVKKLGEQVRIQVSDDGPGIPEEFRSRIFEKFSQADSSDSRQKGGTGLGLAIAKELAEKMGGRVDFESRTGQGSTFYVDLQIVAVKAERAVEDLPSS